MLEFFRPVSFFLVYFSGGHRNVEVYGKRRYFKSAKIRFKAIALLTFCRAVAYGTLKRNLKTPALIKKAFSAYFFGIAVPYKIVINCSKAILIKVNFY